MKLAAFAVALALAAACGGSSQGPSQPAQPGSGSAPPAAVPDTRTELEKRRDAACELLGPKLTQCSVDDSRAQLAAGAITKPQFDEATKPELQRALTDDWRKKCKAGYMSSRQVRVLEVCFREERECAPLQACLLNLDAK